MRLSSNNVSDATVGRIPTYGFLNAAVPLTTNTVLTSMGVLVPILANTTYAIRVWLPFSLAGVVSGFKFAIAGPAAPTYFISSAQVITSAAALLATTISTLGNAFASALATAATHNCIFDATLVNGASAGNVDVQFAQNVSDAGAITILRGASISVTAIG